MYVYVLLLKTVTNLQEIGLWYVVMRMTEEWGGIEVWSQKKEQNELYYLLCHRKNRDSYNNMCISQRCD